MIDSCALLATGWRKWAGTPPPPAVHQVQVLTSKATQIHHYTTKALCPVVNSAARDLSASSLNDHGGGGAMHQANCPGTCFTKTLLNQLKELKHSANVSPPSCSFLGNNTYIYMSLSKLPKQENRTISAIGLNEKEICGVDANDVMRVIIRCQLKTWPR